MRNALESLAVDASDDLRVSMTPDQLATLRAYVAARCLEHAMSVSPLPPAPVTAHLAGLTVDEAVRAYRDDVDHPDSRVRRRILSILARGERTAAELADILGCPARVVVAIMSEWCDEEDARVARRVLVHASDWRPGHCTRTAVYHRAA